MGEEWDPKDVAENTEVAELVRQENLKKNDSEARLRGAGDDDDDENEETVEEGFAFVNREE